MVRVLKPCMKCPTAKKERRVADIGFVFVGNHSSHRNLIMIVKSGYPNTYQRSWRPANRLCFAQFRERP
jgi:hypothetical protein